MTDAQQSLLDWKAPQYFGETFIPALDENRLNAQSRRVYDAMRDGSWKTLREVSDITGDPEASVSARIRTLRAMGYTVDRQRREPKSGLFLYRLSSVRVG